MLLPLFEIKSLCIFFISYDPAADLNSITQQASVHRHVSIEGHRPARVSMLPAFGNHVNFETHLWLSELCTTEAILYWGLYDDTRNWKTSVRRFLTANVPYHLEAAPSHKHLHRLRVFFYNLKTLSSYWEEVLSFDFLASDDLHIL